LLLGVEGSCSQLMRWDTPIRRTLTGIVGQDLEVEFVTGDDAGEI